MKRGLSKILVTAVLKVETGNNQDVIIMGMRLENNSYNR